MASPSTKVDNKVNYENTNARHEWRGSERGREGLCAVILRKTVIDEEPTTGHRCRSCSEIPPTVCLQR